MSLIPVGAPGIRMVGGRRMQCKDIPDEVFLDAVRRAGEPGRWRMRWNVHEVLEAEIGPVPENLFMAKARKLIARGLMDGCACGCCGDFELPEKQVAEWGRRLIGGGVPEFTGLDGLIAAADLAVEKAFLFGAPQRPTFTGVLAYLADRGEQR